MKRATYADFEQLTGGVISIHALVKRATQRNTPDGTCENDFNPRPREEGDIIDCLHRIFYCISIHALVKRATVDILTAGDVPDISIHALVKRATPSASVVSVDV